MRVIHIIRSLDMGGAERWVIDLCLEFNKRSDIEYKLLVLEPGNHFEYLTKDIPYILMDEYYVPSMRKKVKFDNSKYKKIVDDFKPDVIHTNLFRAELYTMTYFKPEIKYVVHGHDNMIQFLNLSLKTLTKKVSITNYFEKWLLIKNKYKRHNNTFFIANSNDTLNFFKKNVPKHLKNNVFLIECGFNLNRFYFPEREFRENTEKIRLINVGRFAVYKNQILLVAIAEKLKEKNIDFELVLLGDGEKFEYIKQVVKDKKLEDCIKIPGKVTDVENWLKKASIYVHSAYYEPFGLVLLEAMANGLPCVILNGKGNADIIQHGVNGYIFDEQNPDLFVDVIMDLASNPSKLKQIAEKGRDYAKGFDIKPKTDELLAFYRKIIGA